MEPGIQSEGHGNPLFLFGLAYNQPSFPYHKFHKFGVTVCFPTGIYVLSQLSQFSLFTMVGLEGPSSDKSSDSHDNSIPFLSPLVYDGAVPRSSGSNRSWDVAAYCQPLSATFNYLSSKLAFQGLHVAVVVLSSRPELLSAWPIDIHTQHFLGKLIARADVKYSLDHMWVRGLNDLCKPVDSREAFERYRATTYLIHRSLSQKDIIFSGDGLTVLAVDYIYKFKEQLTTLALENTFPLFRDDCKESCVELLRHINMIYKDIPLSKSYLQRVYTQLSLRDDILEEICEAYHAKYSLSSTPVSSNFLDSSASYFAQERPPAMYDQLQESPRKLPPSRGKTKPAKTFSARTDLDGATGVDKHALGSPFVFDPLFKWQQADAVARPKSPKGELFESARSAPSTPPKSTGLRRLSKTDDLRAVNTTAGDTDNSPELARAETASMISTRRRKLLAPLLSLTRSKSVSSTTRDNSWTKNWTSELKNKSAAFKLAHPSPALENIPRSFSVMQPAPSFVAAATSTNGSNKHPKGDQATFTHNINLQPKNGARSIPKAVDTKFGWLHVVKKRNGWNMPLSQRVL